MKKLISMILVVVMIVIPFGVLADNNASQGLEKVLIAVKGKIDVPSELTEFSSYISERKEKVFYNFEWSDKEHKRNMSVSCDSEGRIISYYNFKENSSTKKLSSFSKKEIIDFATAFVLKTLPEAFKENDDMLLYDEASYDALGNMRYGLRFFRRKNMVKVKDNYVNVTVCDIDGELFIRNMDVNYNYDIDFVQAFETIDSYEEKYKEAFEAELIYKNEYNFVSKLERNKAMPKLVYRIKDDKIGYIDAQTGEIVEEDSFENEMFKQEASALSDSASGGANRNEILTPQEIEEISEVEGLLSISEIEKAVKKLPYVVFSNELVLTSSELAKNNEDKYIYRIYYSNNSDKEYKYANIVAEAKTGKIINLSISTKYTDENKTLSESQISTANKKISEFLNAIAKSEIEQCKQKRENIYRYNVSKNYMRVVNGIDYIDNGINVSFDVKNNCITSFGLNFSEGEFENPEKAIDSASAYDKIIQYAPIIPLYILNGGAYKKVFTLDCYSIQLDALTGEVMNGYSAEKKNYSYSDISGHWAEEAARKLSEIQIGFEGDTLNPENNVTQEEFLRFFASGARNKYYADYTRDELYELLINEKILSLEEKAPEKNITREEAFTFIIRFANLEKVAQLSDIYKVSYADGNLLSDGKIGYAAILSGLRIVCGDGGALRPCDSLTRAEAVVMLYRYLIRL